MCEHVVCICVSGVSVCLCVSMCVYGCMSAFKHVSMHVCMCGECVCTCMCVCIGVHACA